MRQTARPKATALRPSLVRNVGVLAVCQALFFICNTVNITTSALVGLDLAPNASLATLPVGLQFVGTMATTLPASFLMQRVGRRGGFMLGGALGVIAGIIGCIAILHASFPLFCVAGAVYGAYGAFGQYYRFAAADAADASSGDGNAAGARGRAIGWVMAGGVVAAIAGPELAKATSGLMAPVTFAGCYAAIAAIGVMTMIVAALLDLPAPAVNPTGDSGRPLLEIARQPKAMTAFFAALVAYVTMNLLMTATPLAMVACGHSFGDSATVIQWHVLGMFVPSFFTGNLIARFGTTRIIAVGVGLNAACVAVALAGVSVMEFAVALCLLGIGWNFMFVGATTLLTTCHTPAEKAKVQGMNDFLLFTTVGVSATSAGWLHHTFGWQAMNLLALPLLFAAVMLLVWRAWGHVDSRARQTS